MDLISWLRFSLFSLKIVLGLLVTWLELCKFFSQLPSNHPTVHIIIACVAVHLTFSKAYMSYIYFRDQTGTVDFSIVGASVHQLKGSSSRYVYFVLIFSSRSRACLFIRWRSLCLLFLCSVGAKRVKGLCVTFKEYCDAQNYEGWAFEELSLSFGFLYGWTSLMFGTHFIRDLGTGVWDVCSRWISSTRR